MLPCLHLGVSQFITSRLTTVKPREQKPGRWCARLHFSSEVRGCAWQWEWKRARTHTLSKCQESLSPCSNAMLSPRERGGSQDRNVCPAQIHLITHWRTAQISGSVRKLKQSLLPSTTSQVPHHSDVKNCSIPPAISSFGSTAKHPSFWFHTISSLTDSEAVTM